MKLTEQKHKPLNKEKYTCNYSNTHRLMAIGDIHGDVFKLNRLLEQINPTSNDTLVFLGDYIDRGENSKEVIELLLNLSQCLKCIFLKGNHENMLLNIKNTKSKEAYAHWYLSGGDRTLNSYQHFEKIFELHGKFFENLQNYYQTEDYLFVHAGIRNGKVLEEQTIDDLLWIRDDFIYGTSKLKQKIIFGHTPFYDPYIAEDKIGIDTGCGYDNGYLTSIICWKENFITSE